jgi:lipoyl(octanoyl) transferase
MSAPDQAPLRWQWLGTVPYREAWALQQRLVQACRTDAATADCVVMLEHPPVYTVGRRGDAAHLGAGPAQLVAGGADFVEVDRGGSVTFHGPGQLVAYPIVRLAGAFPIPGHEAHGDVIRYLRSLEQAIIDTASGFGVAAARRRPHTGVWVGDRKLAAIGVKVVGGVTMHGLAINVCNDLSWFSRVVPCGIDGAGVASLETLGAPGLTPEGVAPALAAALAHGLARVAVPASPELLPGAALSMRPALTRTPVL